MLPLYMLYYATAPRQLLPALPRSFHAEIHCQRRLLSRHQRCRRAIIVSLPTISFSPSILPCREGAMPSLRFHHFHYRDTVIISLLASFFAYIHFINISSPPYFFTCFITPAIPTLTYTLSLMPLLHTLIRYAVRLHCHYAAASLRYHIERHFNIDVSPRVIPFPYALLPLTFAITLPFSPYYVTSCRHYVAHLRPPYYVAAADEGCRFHLRIPYIIIQHIFATCLKIHISSLFQRSSSYATLLPHIRQFNILFLR